MGNKEEEKRLIVGERVGRLLLLDEVRIPRKDGTTIRGFLCRCDCGNETTVSYYHLKTQTRSCGCLQVDVCREKNTTHGMSKTRTFKIWREMKARCNNPNSTNYSKYGGRGIKVCERWNNSFEAFLEDMGEPPTKEHSLDRIDNNRDYEPSNCRWATAKEQARNRRNNVTFEFQGKERTLAEIAEIVGVKYSLLNSRVMDYGWTIEEATSLPPRKRRECCTCKGVPIVQYTKDGKYIQEWRSASNAAKILGLNHKGISACVTGKQKTAFGFIWKAM